MLTVIVKIRKVNKRGERIREEKKREEKKREEKRRKEKRRKEKKNLFHLHDILTKYLNLNVDHMLIKC